VDEVAIRAPSVQALFDDWSVEPLELRPLSDEARERIVEAWSEIRKRASGTPVVVLHLPEAERRDGLETTIAAAFRLDMETMKVDARHHWFRGALSSRLSRIGIVVFFLSLACAGLIEADGDEGTLEGLLAQTFVVLGWVALWEPAYRVFTAASFRLSRRHFEELAPAAVRVVWD
jgi:hypothetical protein